MLPRILSRLGLAALLLALPAFAQQESSSAQPATQSNANTQPAAPNATGVGQTDQDQAQAGQEQSGQKADKQPSKLKKILKRAAPNCAHVGGANTCWSESEREKEAREKEAKQRQEEEQQQAQQLPQNKPAPRSDDEVPSGDSSSRSTMDLSPPPGDAMAHEGAAMSDVEEFHTYDPHKAAHDVEVGDFHFKRGNYKAAESRYAEALQWKPNDAIATYRLAQSQEKLGKFADAVKNYQGYLKILPNGEFAGPSKEGIARLSAKVQANPPPPRAEHKLSKDNPPTSPSERTPR